MLTLLGISLFAVGVVSTSPPDISGTWQGEDWGQVTLTQTAPGEYAGTYTDTVGKEKAPGNIDLKWSRIERRFNGTWREGEDDRFGDLSIRLVEKEILGALTTDLKSKINPATPRLSDLAWTPANRKFPAAGTVGQTRSAQFIPGLLAIQDDQRKHPDRINAVSVQLPAYPSLTFDGFRKELHVTPEQEQKLEKVSMSYQIDWLKVSPTVPDKRKFEEELKSSVRKDVERILSAEQLAKYKTLSFRMFVDGMLHNPPVEKIIGLTAEQKKEGLRIEAEMGVQGTTDWWANDHERALCDRLFKILTRDQQEKLREFIAHADGVAREKPEEAGPTTHAKNVPHPSAIQFDGTHYAKLDPPPKFTSGDFTISLWFNPTTDRQIQVALPPRV